MGQLERPEKELYREHTWINLGLNVSENAKLRNCKLSKTMHRKNKPRFFCIQKFTSDI